MEYPLTLFISGKTLPCFHSLLLVKEWCKRSSSSSRGGRAFQLLWKYSPAILVFLCPKISSNMQQNLISTQGTDSGRSFFDAHRSSLDSYIFYGCRPLLLLFLSSFRCSWVIFIPWKLKLSVRFKFLSWFSNFPMRLCPSTVLPACGTTLVSPLLTLRTGVAS